MAANVKIVDRPVTGATCGLNGIGGKSAQHERIYTDYNGEMNRLRMKCTDIMKEITNFKNKVEAIHKDNTQF